MTRHFWQNQRGTATNVLGTIAILTAITAFALVFDLGYLYVKRETLKRGLDYSNMAVFRELDKEEVARGVIFIPTIPAEDTFREFLQLNLRLDGNLHPLAGSVAGGPVVIEEFLVFNPGDLPAATPGGAPISEVSVYSELIVPVQPVFVGLFGPVNLRLGVLTDAPASLLQQARP